MCNIFLACRSVPLPYNLYRTLLLSIFAVAIDNGFVWLNIQIELATHTVWPLCGSAFSRFSQRHNSGFEIFRLLMAGFGGMVVSGTRSYKSNGQDFSAFIGVLLLFACQVILTRLCIIFNTYMGVVPLFSYQSIYVYTPVGYSFLGFISSFLYCYFLYTDWKMFAYPCNTVSAINYAWIQDLCL